MRWFCICLYTWILRLALPFVLLRLLWRSLRLPAYRHRCLERLGVFNYPRQFTNKKLTIWLHAVSLGESIAATPLIKALQEQYPQCAMVITNTTPTGSEKIRQTFGDSVCNVYLPYDLPSMIQRFIRKVQPNVVLIMETELWPNLLVQLNQRAVPVMLINGRLSARSAQGYGKIRKLTQHILPCFRKILVQTQADAERFIAIGAPKTSVRVLGNIKFDLQIPADLWQQAQGFTEQVIVDQRSIFIAASTHEGEEQLILDAFKSIKLHVPNVLLLLVPRHPDRFAQVAKLCEQQGFRVIRRTAQIPCNQETDIFLGDTLGELMLFYAVADVVFVGGSLVPIGGHNLLEPASLQKPMITGPHMHHFRHITQCLLERSAMLQVHDSQQLSQAVLKVLQSTQQAQQMTKQARIFVEQNQGALEKYLAQITKIILYTHRTSRFDF